MSREYVNQVAASIIKQLREGTAPWIRPWRSGEAYRPHNPISGHPYRGMNVVWLMVQSQERGYLDTRWMTYRQAQSTGAQVRRGEKGTTIQYWKWEGTRSMLDDSGAPRRDEQDNPLTERIQYARPRVFTATVFNAEQIDGLAPAAVSRRPPEWERYEKAEIILKASGVPIRHVSQDRAYYSVQHDHIVLPMRSQFPTADGYYATGLHELGHSTGHPSRLNRDMGHPFGSELYAREELRAEFASLMLGDELGIGHDPGQHVAYIGSWIKVLQNDPLEVFRAATAAEKIQTYVLGLAHQQTAEREQPRSYSVATGDRMDPDRVVAALNHELEPQGLQVFRSKLETSPGFGFELHRADGSAVTVASVESPGVTFPKRFDSKTTSAEIVTWWESHQAAAAALTQTPVSIDLDNQKPLTVDVPIPPPAEERANIPANGDRYVVALIPSRTDEREKISEHTSLLEAIKSLTTWDVWERPKLYLKPRDDLTFDTRFVDPDLPNYRQWTLREDATYRPLVSAVWNEDETDTLYVSPVAELEELIDAPSGDDLESRVAAALDAIARFRATHIHTGHVATERVNLQVPYREKDLARQAGAKWDTVAKTWYAPPGADLDALARWPVAPSQRVSDLVPADPRREFADALREAGLVLEAEPQMDGTLHRVPVETDRGSQRSGAYVGHLDGHPAAFIQNYKTGLKTNWKSAMIAHSLSDGDRQRLQQEAAERQAERLKKRMQEQEAVASRARRQLSTAPTAPDDHPYLHIKGFSGNQHALRQDRYGNLLVPAHDIDGTVWSFQRISATGDKRFLKGGRLDGCHALLSSGEIKDRDPHGLHMEQTVLILAEGYATGLTLERATGLPVAVAFSSGNLVHVAQDYRERFPDLHIIVAGDNDHRKPLEKSPNGHPKKNVGKEMAEAAAAAVGGHALLPPFSPEEHGSDWNDLEQSRGVDAVRALIKDGIAVALVNIEARQIAAGLVRFPVNHHEADPLHPSAPELGYVMAASLKEAREKLRRGEWVATQSRAMISVAAIDVFDSNIIRADRERADAQRTVERDRLRLADARESGHNGESVAETVPSDEATAQRPETPIQVRAALERTREAAEVEVIQQSVRDQRRERRRSHSR